VYVKIKTNISSYLILDCHLTSHKFHVRNFDFSKWFQAISFETFDKSGRLSRSRKFPF